MTTPRQGDHRPLLRTAILRGGLFTGLWVLLTEGRGDGWIVPALVIVSATASSLALRSGGGGWSVRGVIRFIPYFLFRSVHAGVDVARRALSPGLPIDPGTEEHLLHLPEQRHRVIFAAILGLLPGTLAVRLRGRRLLIHFLSRGTGRHDSVRELERRLAAVFDVRMDERKETTVSDVQ